MPTLKHGDFPPASNQLATSSLASGLTYDAAGDVTVVLLIKWRTSVLIIWHTIHESLVESGLPDDQILAGGLDYID
jgi:hypothetical protein